MAVNITEWEKSAIANIDNLINKCKLRMFAFEREHLMLTQNAGVDPLALMIQDRAPQRLRYFATDLYSALDYLCYLCHCHYQNEGRPSYSQEARNVNFPYKILRETTAGGQREVCEKKANNFAKKRFETIFGPLDGAEAGGPAPGAEAGGPAPGAEAGGPAPGAEAGGPAPNQNMLNEFKQIILRCQIKTKIDGSGSLCDQQGTPNDAARDFNTLHILRNTAVHRNLVFVNVKPGKLYFNRREGYHEVKPGEIPERENNPELWQSFPSNPGCWITVPPLGPRRDYTQEKILEVAIRLVDFVKDTRDDLLQLAFPHHYGTGENFSVRPFDNGKVRRGMDDGVYIGNNPHYSWDKFDQACFINQNNFDLYAV
ncbi:uncharacterized protein LOC114516117 [Dendronephthya gigantea]|uniref:uncharacterized protein LOC114516117 n=1 Tax=Dendronephthya gigantea TaxID=151771 RepID=UPI0010696A1D|nr:uncharacterized protein LOC114516117 [Dendronephthya gigantea]